MRSRWSARESSRVLENIKCQSRSRDPYHNSPALNSALPQNVWVAEAAEADMDAASPRSIA